MLVQLRKNLLVLRPEEGDDNSLADWLAAHDGQVFRLRHKDGAALHALGPEAEARREPINITSRAPMPLKLASNFAHTPFVLDGLDYASIEGFWQGLKFPDEADRRRLAAMHGSAAKDAGFYAPASETVLFGGERIRVGTWDHWQLMERASMAKFSQHEGAREALLSTGKRPLVHQVRPDSKSIPGVIMAEIWTRIRARLQRANAGSAGAGSGAHIDAP
jgi:predicted NAD-dependent protein-ADP-ribosyltransferase YbiA (DUF1768 family)